MNYEDSFILVAGDCPTNSGVIPLAKSKKKTVAVIQYEMLAGHPYKYTQEDVLFQTHAKHKGISSAELKMRAKTMRAEFFGKPRPCLRTSPLAKTYGWGFHFDRDGKIAIYAVESSQYKQFAKQASKIFKAFGSGRK